MLFCIHGYNQMGCEGFSGKLCINYLFGIFNFNIANSVLLLKSLYLDEAGLKKKNLKNWLACFLETDVIATYLNLIIHRHLL